MALAFVAILAFALIADWWKENSTTGWIITGILLVILAFSLFRFSSFRGLFLKAVKTTGENIVYDTGAPKREPLPSKMRRDILQRARNRCENPDCKANTVPEIHHIDNNNSHNNPRNLIALCPRKAIKVSTYNSNTKTSAVIEAISRLYSQSNSE